MTSLRPGGPITVPAYPAESHSGLNLGQVEVYWTSVWSNAKQDNIITRLVGRYWGQVHASAVELPVTWGGLQFEAKIGFPEPVNHNYDYERPPIMRLTVR